MICGCDDAYCDSVCSTDYTCGCDDNGTDTELVELSLADVEATPDLVVNIIMPRHNIITAKYAPIEDYNTAITWLNRLYQRAVSQGLKFSDDIIILWYRTQMLKQYVSVDYLTSTISYLANREFQDFLNTLTIGGGSVDCPSDCSSQCSSYCSDCPSDCGCDDCSDCSDCGIDCSSDCGTYCGSDEDCSYDTPCDVCGAGDCGSGDACDYCSGDGGWN